MYPEDTNSNSVPITVPAVRVDGNGQTYGFHASIGVLLPHVSPHICDVRIHFATVVCTETGFARRTEYERPGIASVTFILHFSLVVHQSFCTSKRPTTL